MARDWKESDHPRHPAKSLGGAGGRFRENIGGPGWAMRLASMLGRRGASSRSVGQGPGGRSTVGDTSAGDLRRALEQSDADYARGLNPRDAAIRDRPKPGRLPWPARRRLRDRRAKR